MNANSFHDTSQSGNVFLYILIGVALFAALAFTFSRTGQQGTGNLTKQQAKVYAQEILSYARLLEQTVNRLRRKGCSETQISFQYDEDGDGDYNDNDETYYNANAPTDHSCHMFHPDGGKLTWQTLPDLGFDQSLKATSVTYGSHFFVGFFNVVGSGEDCASLSCSDLVFIVSDLREEVCEQINSLQSIAVPASEAITNYHPQSYAPVEFIGAFSFVNAGSYLGNEFTDLDGENAGCFLNAAGGSHIPSFYQVLLAR